MNDSERLKESKAKRDPKEVEKLISKGIVRLEEGIPVVDAARLDGPPIYKETSYDPRRDIGKKKSSIEKEIKKDIVVEELMTPGEKKILLPPDLKKKQTLEKSFERRGFEMSENEVPKGVGLDIGTAFLVSGRFQTDGKVSFRKFRDCFLELEPKSPINKKFIKKGLEDRKAPFIEKNDHFYVLGEEAFLMANERHLTVKRPMSRGVLSPQEREAFPILQEIIKHLVGKPQIENERLVFSVPAKPIDAEFDQLFHQDMIRSFISECGYNTQAMNEAEALAYSELLDDGLTGVALSCGAGMFNVAVLSSGDPVLAFSTSKSGDWIDQQAAIATNTTPSIVQQEKEDSSFDIMNPTPGNQIHAALSVYYGNVLVYNLKQIAYDLSRSPALPKFKDAIPLVVGGGTSMPKGFIEKFKQALGAVDMPIAISQVRHASDPLYAVAHGLTLAATME